MIKSVIKLATGGRVVASLAALGLGGTLLFRLSPYDSLKALLGDAGLPEETITSPDQLAKTLEALGEAGRESYLQFQLCDLVNPILIGLAGAMLLGWLLKRVQRADSKWRFVVLLPVVLLTADLVENLIISIAVGAYPDPAAIGNALPIVTAGKFGAAFSTFVAVVLLALVWLRDTLLGTRRQGV